MASSQEQPVGGIAAKAAVAFSKPVGPQRRGRVELLVQIVILAALFFVRFFHVLYSLWNKWRDPNWGHGYLVPLFSLWFLYIRRHKLKRVKLQREWVGIAVLVLGMGIEFWSMYFFRFDYGRYIGLLISVFGLVLFLGGWSLMRHAWVAVLFLIFMLPVPYQYYERVASPLQELAARASVGTLNLCQVKAYRQGTVIQIPMGKFDSAGNEIYEPLSVIEACAGLRLLMAFIALGVAFAYLSDKPIWQRAVLIEMTVPIAVFCNMVRVSGTGLLYRFVPEPHNKTVATGFLHDFAGWIMLLVAMVLLFAIGAVLARLSRRKASVGEEKPMALGLLAGIIASTIASHAKGRGGKEKDVPTAKAVLPPEAFERLSRIPLIVGAIALLIGLMIAGAVVAARLGGVLVVLGAIVINIAGIWAIALYEKARRILGEDADRRQVALLGAGCAAGVAAVLSTVAALAVVLVRSG